MRPFFFGRGFTLVELIVFLLIAGVLVVVAAMLFQESDLKSRYQAERLAADIRHIQSLAMTRQQTLRMSTSLGGYVVCVKPVSGSCVTPITDPATGAGFSVSLEAGLVLSPATDFDLDSLGRPLSGTGFATANVQFTVTGGATSNTVTVRPITGFVTVP